ncbi:MAG: trypsin-like serine protease [Candidatus Scalindua sp.]|nr:trypsin-like serine protease [Candidatus Scalindua sp.]
MRKIETYNIVIVTILLQLASLFCPIVSGADDTSIRCHREPFVLDSGVHENLRKESSVPFRETMIIPGVPWMQIHVSASNLGERSCIVITSLYDGGQQRLDTQSLVQWHNSSAYLNGEAVEIALVVGPGESGIFFRIEEITVGEWIGNGGPADGSSSLLFQESICGSSDNRVSSEDPAVGRIMPAGCTGWIISNGAFLTAGHCSGIGYVLQFNVPASLPDGTPLNPLPEDQYPVTYLDFHNNDEGDDWAIFQTGTNNKGQQAIERQRAFYRVTHDISPESVSVTGYGIDSLPRGTTGGRNSDNQTQQTHTGHYIGKNIVRRTKVIIEYLVDTLGGNSGAPVIITQEGLTLGIHTHSGCNPPHFGNQGTGFQQRGLKNAIQTFPGVNVEYVDKGYPELAVRKDGTVFRPFNTVQEGVNAASAGAVISIVKGSYHESVTITKNVVIEAPVGTVIIGQ